MNQPGQSPARHLFLVATQSKAAGQRLTKLRSAADELFGVLTDPLAGGCVPSPATDPASLRSGSVNRQEIEEAFHAALRAAAGARATLVLAFLGHGQVAPGGTRLWYMAADSEDGTATGSMDVNALLDLAADQQGVEGVIALLDTCHAGAGLPDTASLTGGFRGGRKRLAVLMACGTQQEAYDLGFSRRVSEVLTRGLPDTREFVRPGDVKLAIAPGILQQDVQALEFDGDAVAGAPLWLARNVRREARGATRGVGPIGAEDLARALEWWPNAPATPAAWTRQALVDLTANAAAAGAGWAAEVATGLLAATDTGDLIVDLTGANGLTTRLLRRLAAEFSRDWSDRLPEPVRPPGTLEGRPLLQYLLEHAALRMHAPTESGYRALAWYLAAAAEACGVDLSDDRVTRWTRQTGARIALNDAQAMRAERRTRDRAPHLVISLHAARIDWPDSLSVCLREGPDCRHHELFACTPDREGVELLLPDVLAWAEDRLPDGGQVQHIDIVAPTPVLLDWHPEETVVGLYRLGVTHSVSLRWADRLVVPRHLRGFNEQARGQLERIAKEPPADGAPVDWVHPADAAAELQKDLQNGRYRRAIGIAGHPGPTRLRELAAVLLHYTPILLWPVADAPAPQAARDCVSHLWEALPDGFGEAYRHRWQGGDQDPTTGTHLNRLADLRTAWHDLDWLDFCSSYTHHSPPAAPRSS
ncbi:hypothetical protein [Kitasatospora sp. NPDC056800]|uniref:vWA-MoxR associated conflict system protein n=1 Tax=Kitasatospora sp. NPDC056800 TaxID=3345948 RepID=UPI0036757053